jgi:hypothetical protein
MMQSQPDHVKKAEFALVQSLKKVRDDVERHVAALSHAFVKYRAEVEMHVLAVDCGPVPMEVYYAGQDVLESIDAILENLMMDVDAEVDAAANDIGR